VGEGKGVGRDHAVPAAMELGPAAMAASFEARARHARRRGEELGRAERGEESE
jgi:hypothetical protein